MSKELTKKLVEEFKKIKGEARGIHFKSDANFILKKKGKDGLKKVEKELKKLGYAINYEKIKNLDFYPVGLRNASLLAARKVFKWKNDDIREMCGFAAKESLIVRLYMKYFYSISKLIEKGPSIWKEYYTVGKFEITDYDDKKKYVIIKITDFYLHPVYCRCIEGYLENIVNMIVHSKEINCKEIKRSPDSQKYHEFEIKW